MDEGVILLVGDRHSVFTSDANAFLSELPSRTELRPAGKIFKFQRD